MFLVSTFLFSLPILYFVNYSVEKKLFVVVCKLIKSDFFGQKEFKHLPKIWLLASLQASFLYFSTHTSIFKSIPHLNAIKSTNCLQT